MIRIAWMTDIHLNFVKKEGIEIFCRKIKNQFPDVVLIGGDIGEATNVKNYLTILGYELNCNIYFVLGNHDFYRGSIREVKAEIKSFSESSDNVKWLSDVGVVELTEDSCLIGTEAWADGRYGNYLDSDVFMNDYVYIKELADCEYNSRLKLLNRLGDEAARYFEKILPLALEKYRNIYVLVHVPPFKEASLYEGTISNDDWLPHFTSKAVGDVLKRVMEEHPDSKMIVLCGHTHSQVEVDILPNLHVKTAGAEYRNPKIEDIFEL